MLEALADGSEADCSNYNALMEARDSDPGIMLADKGYDSDLIWQDLSDRGVRTEGTALRSHELVFERVGEAGLASPAPCCAACCCACPTRHAQQSSGLLRVPAFIVARSLWR